MSGTGGVLSPAQSPPAGLGTLRAPGSPAAQDTHVPPHTRSLGGLHARVALHERHIGDGDGLGVLQLRHPQQLDLGVRVGVVSPGGRGPAPSWAIPWPYLEGPGPLPQRDVDVLPGCAAVPPRVPGQVRHVRGVLRDSNSEET